MDLKIRPRRLDFTQYLKERHLRYFKHQSKFLIEKKNNLGGTKKSALMGKMEMRN